MANKTPDVQELVKFALEQKGFQGLYNEDNQCGCKIDDLFPCSGEGCESCRAGYVIECKPEMCANCAVECEGYREGTWFVSYTVT